MDELSEDFLKKNKETKKPRKKKIKKLSSQKKTKDKVDASESVYLFFNFSSFLFLFVIKVMMKKITQSFLILAHFIKNQMQMVNQLKIRKKKKN